MGFQRATATLQDIEKLVMQDCMFGFIEIGDRSLIVSWTAKSPVIKELNSMFQRSCGIAFHLMKPPTLIFLVQRVSSSQVGLN